MIHKIEIMSDMALLQLLLDIENLRHTGYINTHEVEQRLQAQRNADLRQKISQSGFSKEEILDYLKNLQKEEPSTNGVTIVAVSDQQQSIIDKHIAERENKKLQSLIDKWNSR